MTRYQVSSNSNDGRTQIGDRDLPNRFTLTVTNEEDSPHPDLRLDFAVRDGVPECRGVHVFDLRSIKIDDWLEYAVSRAADVVVSSEGGVVSMVDTIDPAEIERTVKLVRRVRSKGRRTVTDDLLREVAAIYRANIDNNPTEVIAKRFDKTPRSARSYVQQARARGFLGAAIKGKAGEQ
jgi:hypothetical protein